MLHSVINFSCYWMVKSIGGRGVGEGGRRGGGWDAVDIQKKVEMVNINQNIISGTEN